MNLICPFLVAVFCGFSFQARLACFNEKNQNMNDLILRDKVEESKNRLSFDLELTKFPKDLSHHKLVLLCFLILA